MNTVQNSLVTPVGRLYLVASEGGLQGIFWKKQNVPAKGPSRAMKFLRQAERELKEYFGGKRKRFTVPLDVQGTAFQKKVWKALSAIPYGRAVSYKEVASRIGLKKAVRAVGNANGKNPVCIVVPCHRVLAHDGTIGGYSGGLGIKRKLLDLEKISVR